MGKRPEAGKTAHACGKKFPLEWEGGGKGGRCSEGRRREGGVNAEMMRRGARGPGAGLARAPRAGRRAAETRKDAELKAKGLPSGEVGRRAPSKRLRPPVGRRGSGDEEERMAPWRENGVAAFEQKQKKGGKTMAGWKRGGGGAEHVRIGRRWGGWGVGEEGEKRQRRGGARCLLRRKLGDGALNRESRLAWDADSVRRVRKVALGRRLGAARPKGRLGFLALLCAFRRLPSVGLGGARGGSLGAGRPSPSRRSLCGRRGFVLGLHLACLASQEKVASMLALRLQEME